MELCVAVYRSLIHQNGRLDTMLLWIHTLQEYILWDIHMNRFVLIASKLTVDLSNLAPPLYIKLWRSGDQRNW